MLLLEFVGSKGHHCAAGQHQTHHVQYGGHASFCAFFYPGTMVCRGEPLATMLGPEDQLRKLGSCGKAVRNVETRVVNDAMQDVAVGEVDEPLWPGRTTCHHNACL